MSRQNIVSISEVNVLFDPGDGSGFTDTTLVTVVTVDGTTYVWRGSSNQEEMLDWIDGNHTR